MEHTRQQHRQSTNNVLPLVNNNIDNNNNNNKNLQQSLTDHLEQKVEMKRMIELIRRLRANDPNLIHLDFRNVNGTLGVDKLVGSGDTTTTNNNNSSSRSNHGNLFHELLDALRWNIQIKSVNIILRFLNNLSNPDKFLFFEAIGSIPHLEHFRVGSSGFSGLPLKLVTQTLLLQGQSEKKRTLRALQLHSVHFRGIVQYKRKNNNNNNSDRNNDDDDDEEMNTQDEEMVAFCQALQEVQELEFVGLNDMETTFDLNPVVHTVCRYLPKLKTVHLKSFEVPSQPRLSETSVQLLCGSPTIQSLKLQRLHLLPLIPLMTREWEDNQNSVLETLNLEYNQMDGVCCEAIARLLQTDTCMIALSVLQLGYNMIPDEGGMQLAQAVANNHMSKLERLELQTNMLGFGTANAFADGLRNQSYPLLKHLVLSQNELGDEGCQEMSNALSNNTSLTRLAMAEINVGDDMESFTSLATMLATNTTLQHLNLSDNKIRNMGCRILAYDGLGQNSTLQSLSLNANKLGNQSVLDLASVLESSANDTLQQLNLAGNENIFGPEVYRVLVQLLQRNMSLKELWIPSSGGGDDESMIAFYLKLNRIGRQDLLRTASSNVARWVEAFAACSERDEDWNVLYYLVRSNPAVFDAIYLS